MELRMQTFTQQPEDVDNVLEKASLNCNLIHSTKWQILFCVTNASLTFKKFPDLLWEILQKNHK